MARIVVDVLVMEDPCDQDGFSFGYSLKLLICIYHFLCKSILNSFASCLFLQIEDEREISDEEAVNTNDGPVSMVFTGPVQATLVTVSCKYSLQLQNMYYQP